MQRVRNNLCAEAGKTSYKCGGHWSRAAQTWRWRERARAWDLDTLRTANLAAITQEQARAMFGQMSRFLITADDLIVAQRALQHRMHAIEADPHT